MKCIRYTLTGKSTSTTTESTLSENCTEDVTSARETCKLKLDTRQTCIWRD